MPIGPGAGRLTAHEYRSFSCGLGNRELRLEPDDRGEVDEVEANLHQPRVADEDIDAHWPCTGWRSVSRGGRT